METKPTGRTSDTTGCCGRRSKLPPVTTAVAHPCDRISIEGVVEAARLGLIAPILVGPPARIRDAAAAGRLDISASRLEASAHSHDSAAKAVELVRQGKAEALMKGSLHTDELMGAVVARDTGIRTARRISHCFVMDVPGHTDPLIITDAAVNIAPTLADKVDIVQNAIDLGHALGFRRCGSRSCRRWRPSIPKVPSTIEAAALCKMADRGQITGGDSRRPAGARQRDQRGGRGDQAHRLAGRGPGQCAGSARSRSRQHAGQEPVVPGRRGRRRHRPRRAGADHSDQPRRQRHHPSRVLRRREPGGRRARRRSAAAAIRMTEANMHAA